MSPMTRAGAGLLLTIVLSIALLATGATAHAAGRYQAGPTDTPTPAGTPAYQTSVTLSSGNQLVIIRSWTFGELADFLAVIALCALYGLHWIFEYTSTRQGH